MSELAERILSIRKENKLSQSAFGEKLNLSQNFVWMLESGKRLPSDRTIADICRVFKINEAWLRTGKGDMYSVSAKSDAILTTLASALGPTNTEQDRFLRAVAQIPREYIIPISQAALTIARAMYPDLFASEPATSSGSESSADSTESIPPPD